MRFCRTILLVACALLGAMAGPISAPAQTPLSTDTAFDRDIRPLLREYCLGCHSTEKQKGELDLEQFQSIQIVRAHPKIWQGVIEQIETEEMPPKDKPQPTPAQRQQLTDWIHAVLNEIALARAGDPGPVVLRRLANAEYTYTLRDLTGVNSLDPAREFPVDSASGEGFMNVGQSLVMSPSLITKYLDAAKSVAEHAVLLPDSIRFSAHTTRRDWTEEILTAIRAFYRGFSEPGGGSSVNLQGIKFDTKDGGVLPIESYLRVLLEERAEGGRPSPKRRHLSERYLRLLDATLASTEPSVVLDPIRARWRTAQPSDAAALASELARWQQALWRFNSVGHIGKTGGPKAWMEPVSPLLAQQELRFKLARDTNQPAEMTAYMVASDAGDGDAGDVVVWEEPRLVAPGRPTLPLRDLRARIQGWSAQRRRVFAQAFRYLAAAAEVETMGGRHRTELVAQQHQLEPTALAAWLHYLGLESGDLLKVEGHMTNRITSFAGYGFIQGWGTPETPNLAANASDQAVRVPGNMKPLSVAIHPSPKRAAAIGWRSPIAASMTLQAFIQHAHPECGNGVTWSLELRRGSTRQRLAQGVSQGGKEIRPDPIPSVHVRPGDLISLLIGARDGNHSCDLTAIDLTLTPMDATGRSWQLSKDVATTILAGNPHADRYGNEEIWHFYTEPDKAGTAGPSPPAGSLVARWQSAQDPAERRQLAEAIQTLLQQGPRGDTSAADAALFRQLDSLGGPLFAGAPVAANATASTPAPALTEAGEAWAIDPARFGRHPDGSAIGPNDLCLPAPHALSVRLPADLAEGYELVVTGKLHERSGDEGSVQLQVLARPPESGTRLVAGSVAVADKTGPWTSHNRAASHSTPILTRDGGRARARIEQQLESVRRVFPAALCYTKIVPVDEVVTLTLYYREDEALRRLMLTDAQAAHLDRLWDELHYVSHDALTLVDAYEQLWQYATQDADPKVFEPMREPIQRRAAAFRERLVATEPFHVQAILDFAEKAYRRPVATAEREELRGLYQKLRSQELSHDAAIRLTLARVLVSPAFLYRIEKPGAETQPVSDHELASRLSYFLWASAPDAELAAVAGEGKLRQTDVLLTQTRRMLQDPRVRRLATEFACTWLHIYDFDQLSEKSDRHFPSFASRRGDLYEEAIRFMTDFFQANGSVLSLIEADHTFLNGALAEYYGIPDVTGPEWRKVTGLKQRSGGGILTLGATLAKQAGASRTSPILRGNWVAEVLLGEKLPRPPKDVPQLPEDEATEQLTVRQLVEKHSSDPKCYGCHRRIDPYGYALEGFDAIGRPRERDLAGRPIDTRTTLMDGTTVEGLAGLRRYLLTSRRDAVVKQFCRKLLGYALGRSVRLSDEPFLNQLRAQLPAHDFRIAHAVEAIVTSRQFREIRGQDMASDD